jgi:inner membrane protein
MENLAQVWWVWLCAALGLALIELVAPVSIFLGFALGALAMAGIVAFTTIDNTSALLALFAALSLIAWIVLKLAFKNQSSGARIVERDINEN